MKKHLLAPVLWMGFAAWVRTAGAWDYEGHRLVNQVALASLPASFPAFVRTPEARERIAFLAGEPDRWRNTSELNHANGPEHFLDLEELTMYGLEPAGLDRFRYDFVAAMARARAAHPEKFKPVDPAQDRDHTRQLPGFLPWAILDNFDRLKSTFSALKAFEDAGTPEEVANAQANAIYHMGVMGHYVGDGAQPLHTTIHFNGWGETNAMGYTTRPIHSWIDGGYFQKIGGVTFAELSPAIQPAAALPAGETFKPIVDYLVAQQKLVEPLYQMEKAGKLSGEGPVGLEGKPFLTKQLVVGGEMLGSLWLTAWQQAGPDNYLRSQLARRKLKSAAGEAAK